MPMNLSKLRIALSELGNWAMEQSVAEVPADLALCEFDCRKSECSRDEWVDCKRRISSAAGELTPCVRQEHAGNVRTIETDRELVAVTDETVVYWCSWRTPSC